jgi:hypothetical protein
LVGAADGRAQAAGGQIGGRSIVLSQTGCARPFTHWQVHPASAGENAANPMNKTKNVNLIFIAIPPSKKGD